MVQIFFPKFPQSLRGIAWRQQRVNLPDGVAEGVRAPGAITGGVDEREVLPSHDCEVCNIEQPFKSGSATVPRDWPLGVPSRGTPNWKSRSYDRKIGFLTAICVT